MTPSVLAAEGREASPIGLVVVLFLVVAVVLLIRSMNRHLRKVPPSFAGPDGAAESVPGRSDATVTDAEPDRPTTPGTTG